MPIVGLLVLTLALANGCTLVGAGVGAAVDSAIPGPYERRSPVQTVRIQPRERIRLWRANGERIDGRYLGSFGPTPRDPELYLIIERPGQPRFVRSSELKGLAVEVTGKGWLYGGLAGLAVDASLVIIAAILLGDMRYGPTWSEGPNCFC